MSESYTPPDEDEDIWSNAQPAQMDPATLAIRNKIVQEILRRSAMGDKTAPKFPETFKPEELKAKTDEMRSRQTMGNILLASGDKKLSPLALTLAKTDPDKYEADQKRQDQVRQYQQWQADQSSGGIGPLAQTLKALGTGMPKIEHRPMPSTVLTEMKNGRNDIDNMSRFEQYSDAGDTQALGKVITSTGADVKTVEDLANWTARNGTAALAGHPELAQQARFWADLNATLVAPWRNKTFGATLTPNEQEAFNDMLGMSAATPISEVKKRLSDITSSVRQNARTAVQFNLENYGAGHAEGMHKIWGDRLSHVSNKRSWMNPDPGGKPQLEIDKSGREPGKPADHHKPGATITGKSGVTAEVIE